MFSTELMTEGWWNRGSCHGKIEGLNVVVSSEEEGKALYDEGAFGTMMSIKDSAANAGAWQALYLTLEEAFFLSYALGCLAVYDGTSELDLVRQWETFCKLKKNFPIKYVTYHHFRAKGWVPKQGLKFGVDFVLYKLGPKYYHADYAVVIMPDEDSKVGKITSMSWTELAGTGRLTNSVAKSLLMCMVTLPEGLEHPSCLNHAAVKEVLFSKWGSTKEDNEEDTDAGW